MRLILTLGLLLWTVSAAAQQVYKCTDAAGNPVYSQRPCSQDPAKVETVDTSRSLKSGSSQVLPTTREQQSLAQIDTCDRLGDEIRARYSAEFQRIDQQAADLRGATPAQRSEIARRRQDLLMAQAAELKKAEKTCREPADS